MSPNLNLISMATEISSLIKDLHTCLNHFDSGKKDQALDTLDEVEGEIQDWKKELKQNANSPELNEDLIRRLSQAQQNLAWIRGREGRNS